MNVTRAFVIAASLLAARSASAEGPLETTWRFAAGDAFALGVESERESTMKSGKEPMVTRFKMKFEGLLVITKVREDGGADATFTFTKFRGTLGAFDMEMELAEGADPAGKEIPVTLTAGGELAFDEKAIKEAIPAHDISDDLRNLLPRMPAKALAEGEKWPSFADLIRIDTSMIGKTLHAEDDRVYQLFSGTSAPTTPKTDESARSAFVEVEGQLEGKFDVTSGNLAQLTMERKEHSVLLAKGEIKLQTWVNTKRTVTIEREQKK